MTCIVVIGGWNYGFVLFYILFDVYCEVKDCVDYECVWFDWIMDVVLDCLLFMYLVFGCCRIGVDELVMCWVKCWKV